MKAVRVVFSWMVVAAMLLASAFSVHAIGFEAEKAYESVFVIYSGNSLGSGFAVGENCIVTNAHVIDDARSITVVTYGGEEYTAAVLGMDEQADLAILVVQDVSFPYLEIADLSAMKTGDDIYAIGAPKGMAYTLTKGGISAKERMIGGQSYIQIDAPINAGNSGGPLLNDAGQVLGVNTLKMSDSEGIGLAIPISRVCEYLEAHGIELNAAGNVVSGVTVPDAPPQSTPRPTAVPDIVPDSPQPDSERDARQPIPPITYAAIGIAVLSLAANVRLMVLLQNEKKKCATLQYTHHSERTDFEIEILE